MRADRRAARLSAGFVLLAGLGCQKPETPPAPPQPTPAQVVEGALAPVGQYRLVGCPGHTKVTVRSTDPDSAAAAPRTFTRLAFAGDFTLIPEYNDCQKFIVGSAYKDEYAIFADPTVTDIPDEPRRAVALILAGGRWQDLGIAAGYNCLYLWRGNGNQVRAKMVPVQDSDMCNKSTSADENLRAKPRKRADHEDVGDYPRAARWDTDERNETYIISIRCDIARVNPNTKERWCEVGPKNGQFSHRADHTVNVNKPEKTRFEVKGWYDEQILAVRSGNTLTPSTGLANLVPDPGLDARPQNYYQNQFRQVARVHINSDVQAYRDDWALKMGDPSRLDYAKLNAVALCQGSASDCGVEQSKVKGDCTYPNPANANDPWWARITSHDNQTTVYRCVQRTRHSGPLPETARWAWSDTDESMWVRCVFGCCWIK